MIEKIKYLFFFLFAFLTIQVQAQHIPSLECPSLDHPTCATTGNRRDEDIDNSNADTPPPSIFVATGTGYAAYAKDFQLLGGLAFGTDPVPLGVQYVHLPPGQISRRSQMSGAGIPAGDKYVWIRAISNGPPHVSVWIDSMPFVAQLDNTLASALFDGQVKAGFDWSAVGSYDVLENDDQNVGWEARRNTIQQRPITISDDGLLVLSIQPGQFIDCVYVDADPDATPSCPDNEGSGGGGGVIADYKIKKINTAAPTSCADTRFAQANKVSWTGFSVRTDATPTLQALWEDAATDRLYLCLLVPDNGLRGTTTTDDTFPAGEDWIEFIWRDEVSQATKDAETFKIAMSVAGGVFDTHYPSNVGTSSFDLNVTKTITLSTDIDSTDDDTSWQAFIALDLGFAGSNGKQFSGDFLLVDRDQAGTALSQFACGTDPVGANNFAAPKCVFELDSTIAQAPADTTAPTITARSSTSTSNTISLSCTAKDNIVGPLRAVFDYGLATSYLGGGSPSSPTSSLQVTGSDCIDPNTCSTSITISSLTPGATYHWRCRVFDQAGNETIDTDQTIATVASGDDIHYVATTGSDANPCTSGSECATVQGVTTKANFTPGDTIVVRDGTYNSASNKYIEMDCSISPSKRNGTAAKRITLKSETPLGAHFVGNGHLKAPFNMDNCHYWTIEDFWFTGQDHSDDSAYGSPVSFKSSGSNIIFRRNLVNHNNQCNNSVIVRVEDVTDSLFEGNELYDYHRNGFGAGSRNIYRDNYMHSQSAATPTCYGSDTGTNTVGDSAFIIYSGQTNLDMLFEGNIVENSAIGFEITGGAKHKRQRFFGNIFNDTKVAGGSIHTRDAGFKEGDHVENNVFLRHVSTGLRCRGSKDTTFKRNTINGFTTGKPGLICDVPTDGYGDLNYSWFFIQNLVINHAGTGIEVEHPVSNGRTGNISNWEVVKNNAFGNTSANFRPTSGGTITNSNGTSTGLFSGNTTVDPQNGNALSCILTTSPMHRSQRADGLMIGADTRYRYVSPSYNQAGVLTTNKKWVERAGLSAEADATCPTSSSGWYPYNLLPCKAGVNNTLSTSHSGVADRVIATSAAQVTTVLNGCEDDGTY